MTQIEVVPGLYAIREYLDGTLTWQKFYENPIEAANDFAKFVDHGTASFERIVTLANPDGSQLTKTFSTIGVEK
jgi:hypothetical protein